MNASVVPSVDDGGGDITALLDANLQIRSRARFLRGRRDWGLMERRPQLSTHTATPTK
ncbi:MAG TPA: hypothetical protein VMM12_02430 [Longimicrobiales bacterium]|nr:hypothetical protein [Longimicrobiales bacterium]